jgi:hypothetical protein
MKSASRRAALSGVGWGVKSGHAKALEYAGDEQSGATHPASSRVENVENAQDALSASRQCPNISRGTGFTQQRVKFSVSEPQISQ